MELKYPASYEIKEVTAKNISEFIDKVKSITTDGKEVTNITALVVTVKLL